MTKDEMDQIVNRCMEEILVQMPTVIGNLMKNHALLAKLNHEFYSKHPEFQNHKDVVTSVISQIEGGDLSLKYEDILSKAAPVIKDRLNTIGKLDMNVNTNPQIPNTINFDASDNGII